MTYLLIIFAVIALFGIGVFLFVKSRIQQFRHSYFEIAAADLKRAYKQTLKESKRLNLDVAGARHKFDAKADLILSHYFNQVYDGPENAPVNEYRALVALKKNSLKGSRSLGNPVGKING